MQKKIDAYFEECEGRVMMDKNGDPVFDKFGRPVILGARPPTVTGLALALDLSGRQELLNYSGAPAFMDTITRAKARIQSYAEGRLFDRDGARGAEFSLRCNFGWNSEGSGGPVDTRQDDPLTASLREAIKGNGSKR